MDDSLSQVLAQTTADLILDRGPMFGTSFSVALADIPPEDLHAVEVAHGDLIDMVHTALRVTRGIQIPVPAELLALVDQEEGHVALVRTIGRTTSQEAKAVGVATAMATMILVPDAIVIPVGWRQVTGVELLLVNVETGMLAWYGQHIAELNPWREDDVDAVITAILLELYTGRHVDPRSFVRWPNDVAATAWLHEGGRVSGRLQQREGLYAAFKLPDESIERVHLSTVRSIRVNAGGVIYPARGGRVGPARF